MYRPTEKASRFIESLLCGLFAAVAVLILSSCVQKPEEPPPPKEVPRPLLRVAGVRVQENGSPEGLTVAAERHLQTLDRRLASPALPEDEKARLEESRRMTTGILEALQRGDLNQWLQESFDFYRAGDPGSVLVTGYYTPVIEAKKNPDEKFRYPIYGLPPDLVTVDLSDFEMSGIIRGRVNGRQLIPYYSRDEITRGVAPMPPPLMYVEDPVDLFFLHIQGSGVALLDDGERVRLNYASGNGRRYGSLGKALIEDGKIPASEMSMESIRRYFNENPNQMNDYFSINESYVFFRTSGDGPYGSTGALVTAGRTIAADATLYPELGVAYLETEIPVGRNPDGSVKTGLYQAIVFHQDAGGAITGPHIDLYYGEGGHAGYLAGHTKTSGTLYYLKPKV